MVQYLLASDPGDGHLHESFYVDQPKEFTRSNFGWPNSLFAEFILREFGIDGTIEFFKGNPNYSSQEDPFLQ